MATGETNVVKRVEAAIAQLRPFLKEDGGDVELLEVTDEMVVKLKFTGACESCLKNTMTLKMGLEDSIIRNVPEIKEVIAVGMKTIKPQTFKDI